MSGGEGRREVRWKWGKGKDARKRDGTEIRMGWQGDKGENGEEERPGKRTRRYERGRIRGCRREEKEGRR